MDLGSECSAHESEEDNEVTREQKSHVDDNNVKDNGLHTNETKELKSSGNVDAHCLPDGSHEKSVDVEGEVNSLSPPPVAIKSPCEASPPTTKGFGLKKWKRFKRDVVKNPSAIVDGNKVLKRDYLSSSENPAKPSRPSAEVKQNSEGSVGSTNLLKNAGAVEEFTIQGSSSNSRFAVGPTFAAGAESENSEDRSSKSSTAASAPKMRHDFPAVLGYAREKNKVKNLSGKSVGNSTQRIHQGKVRVESSKKPRGERVKIEKENSHSSMESDSRSSNFVFMQGSFSATSNGKPSGRSMNYDGENSDEAHAGEQQFSEEVQTDYNRENVGYVDDLLRDDVAADLSWEGKEERIENHRPTDSDPLVASIHDLQSVQEALEKEVQKFGEIGKESVSLHHDSVKDNSLPVGSAFADPEVHEGSPSLDLGSEKIRQSASSSLEAQVLSLTQDVKYLESKLEEAKVVLEVKTSRVAELEATLNGCGAPKEEVGSTVDLQQEKCREMETELEGLFQQKMEAEIEYLALRRAIQKLGVAAGEQTTLFEEQKALAEEQTQTLNHLGEAETKVVMLKKQVEELEKYCANISETEKVLKIQRRVYKATSCLLMQLMLLLLVFWLFVMRLSPHSGVVVPT